MPAPVHDFFSTSVTNEIYKQLQAIAEQDDGDGEFAAQIVDGGSSRIFLDTEEEQPRGSSVALQRHPDGQFQHRQAAFPGVVLEVSYSQDGKDLKNLAWEYIQHSNGDIKAVIGIDINYGAKPSTVSLWRSEYTQEDGEDTLDVRAAITYEVCATSSLRRIGLTMHAAIPIPDRRKTEQITQSPTCTE